LLLQAIPLEWQRFAADASPTAHLSVSRPVAAIAAQLVAVDTKSHATLAAKIEWLSWCLAIEQFEQLAANGDLFLHVSNRDSSDTRLFDACADLSNRWNGSGTLGLAFGWEWATSTSEGIALVPRLRDLGLGWMIEDFSGGSTCLEALESTPPDYVLLASAVVRDVADQPRRLQRLEMVKAACDTIGTRLVVPEGTAPADRQACSQLGIALAELASQQNPEPLMAATNS
jgi:EAL domain-containing protein (putative c-di-GMP-specific phosphodiesterase class I)